MSRTNLNMTYSEVPLNQSQMVYQDFTDGQMLQDEFYGRNQAQEDVDFLDEDDGLFTDLNTGNGRIASSTLSYIPASERQQDLLNSSVMSRDSATNLKQPVLNQRVGNATARLVKRNVGPQNYPQIKKDQ